MDALEASYDGRVREAIVTARAAVEVAWEVAVMQAASELAKRALTPVQPTIFKAYIEQSFPSVDHAILFKLLSTRFPEPPVRDLMAGILANGQGACEAVTHYLPGDTLFTPFERAHGLPIGNLTSQLWANVYLDGLDHFVTGKLGRGAAPAAA
jgi:hypothetical protein